jgi:hypothetical protein
MKVRHPSRAHGLGRARLTALSVVAAFAVIAGMNGTVARADLIDAPLGTFRTPMPGEGYLEFQPAALPNFVYGDETTGWVDVRHPALDGTTSVFTPFDRSDHAVNVRTTTLTDNSVPAVTAAPNRPRDFDFASKIYAQAGISVVSAGNRAYTSGTNPPAANFDFALSHGRGAAQTGLPDEELAIRNGLENVLPAVPNTTVEAYYARDLTSGANAETYSPRFDGKPGMFFANQAVTSTFGHELGHMLLNGDPSEDNGDNSNFQFATGQNYAMTDVTVTRGKMTDAQIGRIYLNGGTNARNFVQKPDGDHMNGNTVDFDYVADNSRLQSIANGADNHAGVDKMTWRINAGGIADTDHAGHDHTGLAAFPATPFFGGQSFKFADVFSLTLRYGDYEQGADGVDGLYTREGALDYHVEFVDAQGNTAAGVPVTIFQFGWTETTIVDNWLTRWMAPFDAVGINIWADTLDGHDGISQIDAVIVSTVPEPGAAALALLGVLPLLAGVTRQRRRRV